MITIVISTCNNRLSKLKLPDNKAGVCYVIVHQVFTDNNGFEDNNNNNFVLREDVNYFKVVSQGLSKSRNIGLNQVKTKYAYIMDDDVEFDLDKILILIEYMQVEQVDVGTCQFRYQNGSYPKRYQEQPFMHSVLSVAKVASIEICVKVSMLRKNNILFNECFGLGTALPSGEEYIFLAACLRANLKVKYYPIVTGIHPNETSGLDFFTSTPKVFAKREMLKKIFGWKSVIYIFAFWMKKAPIAYRAGYGLAFTKTMLLGIK